MYTSSKIVYTTVLLFALVAVAAPASLRTEACDEASCTGNKHCKGGSCVCKDGFTGQDCERKACACNPLGGSCNAQALVYVRLVSKANCATSLTAQATAQAQRPRPGLPVARLRQRENTRACAAMVSPAQRVM